MANKYYLPMSLSFYPERACVKLAEFAKDGWLLKKVGAFDICVLEQGPPQDLKYALDFYAGKKNEQADYLEFFKESGWELVVTKKQRYHFFAAPPETPEIFSDEATYLTRIKKEWLYLLGHSLLYIPIGLIILAAWLMVTKLPNFPTSQTGIHAVTELITLIAIIYPLSVAICIVFYALRYRRRKKYFNRPEKLVLLQDVAADFLAVVILGGIVGGVVGMLI